MSHRDPAKIIEDLTRLSGSKPSAVIDRFVQSFELELNHFMEVGVVLEPTALSVITLGQGRAFGTRIGDLIVDWGLDPDPRALIEDLQRSLDTWMLIRVATDLQGRPEMDLYFRKTRPLEETVQWLARQGVNASEQQALRDLGRLAGTQKTGILGASFRMDEPSLFKAYVHTRSGGALSLGERLKVLFEHFRIPGEGWATMLRGVDELTGATEADAYVSLLLGDGDAFDSLKLDLFHVDLKTFEALARTSGLVSSKAPSVADLGQAIGLTCAEHCGFRFTDHGDAKLTVYFSSDSDLVSA
jgi:hypothetical protein